MFILHNLAGRYPNGEKVSAAHFFDNAPKQTQPGIGGMTLELLSLSAPWLKSVLCVKRVCALFYMKCLETMSNDPNLF